MSIMKQQCVSDLENERKNCSFDKEELTNIMDGGVEKTQFRRRLEEYFLRDPEFLDSIGPDYMSHEDRYANELRKACHMIHKFSENEEINQVIGRPDGVRSIMGLGFLGALTRDGNPLQLHLGMFIPTLIGQGTPEQQEKWLGKAVLGEIIGTYAQTEMGHGTFLRGLETTATYDPSTQEFILHTPTITATKWWPGGLGKTANYAVVMAQLYTKRQCYGPHPFLVQLRDERTHQSLPGLTVGEIGPRLGMNTSDNGFLRFDHFRIPRTNMLMKHSQVLEDGTYVKPLSSKLAYGTMVYVRVGICFYSCHLLQKAVTIATRYSAVRHQSEMLPGMPEPQILDYQTQQYKVLPQIATVFALLFSARSVGDTFIEATKSMNEGSLALLPELHALSCGLKALSSTDSTSGIDICRLSCGGHGYLASSSFPRLYTLCTATMTYEGENTVLWLQVARYIIKSYQAAKRGDVVGPSVAYLVDKNTTDVKTDLSNAGLLEACRKSVCAIVAEVESRLQHLCSKGQDFHHAWNNMSVFLVKCAQVHTRYYVCEQYVQTIENLKLSDGLRAVLRNLCRLYVVNHIIVHQGDFLRCGALSASDMNALEEEMSDLLAALRPQAVSIVDAFDLDDFILDSVLGSKDGNVYQRLYEEALKSPLNQKDVPDAYYKYLRPLMKANL
ncbi:peroxisomal acyl-coenzyme A oxidase 1-like [Penaeus indicus]|uniref:peroxisomal acyl-coenzyme A oxidase 1-like n=1 Tax=Penaeus indicus TaxID=29960 RepID=UPI00300C91A0